MDELSDERKLNIRSCCMPLHSKINVGSYIIIILKLRVSYTCTQGYSLPHDILSAWHSYAVLQSNAGQLWKADFLQRRLNAQEILWHYSTDGRQMW